MAWGTPVAADRNRQAKCAAAQGVVEVYTQVLEKFREPMEEDYQSP